MGGSMQRFGEKLRTLRQRHGMTQRQLARELGFSVHGFVGFLESGKKMPSAELVFNIAQFFQVSTDVLLNDDLELDPPPEQQP